MGEFEISSEYFELVKMKPYREKVKILAVLKGSLSNSVDEEF